VPANCTSAVAMAVGGAASAPVAEGSCAGDEANARPADVQLEALRLAVGQASALLGRGVEAGDRPLGHATETNSERRVFSCSFSARRRSTVARV
jgi:hypothetical protein